MTDDLDVLTRLVEYHDHIAPPLVPVADDVRRGRRRVRRNRTIAAGALAAGLAGVVLAASLATGLDRSLPEPAEPTPTPTSTSTSTWVDTAVAATDGYGWDVPDPQQRAKKGWYAVARDHLDPAGSHFEARGTVTSELWQEFTWRESPSSRESVTGQLGLVLDRSGLDPLDGCRYLLDGPRPSNGTESCSAQRVKGPHGENGKVSAYQRLCATWDPGSPGDDARPAPGVTYETCGEFRVAVAVERRDGRVGYLVVDGRGTTRYNPFDPGAMAAAAADARLTLPDSAFEVLPDRVLESIVVEHFPQFQPGPDPSVTEPLGYARAWGRLGRQVLGVQVRAAGGAPTCGRRWLVMCVQRQVLGADHPTAVYVGAWDERDSAQCCPQGSRAASREFVYVGPRHTVIVRQSLVVRADEDALGTGLDQRVIDLLLDPRLQQEAG